MFSVNNEKQTKTNSSKNIGIFLLIFLILFITAFIYLYLSQDKTFVESTKLTVIKKTEEEKVKEDIEMIKKGYVQSISGTIKEISANKDKIVVSVGVEVEEKDYTVAINDKTKFSKVTYISSEIPINDQKGSEDNFKNDFEEEITATDINFLQVGASAEFIFPRTVKLEENPKLVAEQIYVYIDNSQNK